MSMLEELNYWNDRRVRVRDHRSAEWKLDERRMVAIVQCPEWCPLHGEGEQDEHPKCPVCRTIVKLLRDPKLAERAEEECEDAHAEGGPSEDEFMIPFRWVLCEVCHGKGRHVNPSIDCGGLTREDFDDDPDFAESYMRGDYDQACSCCGGRRTMPELAPRTAEQRAFVRALDKIEEEDADFEREVRAERAMGA
jgi:hypothetical protein